MKHLLILVGLGLAMSGCVSAGISQQDSETTYTLAAIGADVALTSGQINPASAGQICLVDNADYKILAATRNVADGVNYVPADNAHAALQADGAKLAPVQCSPPAPKT